VYVVEKYQKAVEHKVGGKANEDDRTDSDGIMHSPYL
jgi:hypothetical protein